jgi:N6-adenosine-specific RNA methylase IME4
MRRNAIALRAELERNKTNNRQVKKLLAFPERKFSVVYGDPPWQYGNERTRSAAAKNYATLSIEDLKRLPIGRLCKPDCALLLWSTGPFVDEAIRLGESWGFEYKTIGFLWAKRNKVSNSPFFGMGNYTRANVEPCLLFTRGSPKVRSHAVSQFVWTPIERHSEKPAVVRNLIVQLFGDVARLELFSRHRVKGWERWGNEVLK